MEQPPLRGVLHSNRDERPVVNPLFAGLKYRDPFLQTIVEDNRLSLSSNDGRHGDAFVNCHRSVSTSHLLTTETGRNAQQKNRLQ